MAPSSPRVVVRAQFELRQKEGRLVDRDEVHNALFANARNVRDAILGIPDRIAELLAAESDSGVVCRTLDEELREALELLSQEVRV